MMVTQRKEMAGWGVIFVLVALNGAQLEQWVDWIERDLFLFALFSLPSCRWGVFILFFFLLLFLTLGMILAS